jgi:hypothetical protein
MILTLSVHRRSALLGPGLSWDDGWTYVARSKVVRDRIALRRLGRTVHDTLFTGVIFVAMPLPLWLIKSRIDVQDSIRVNEEWLNSTSDRERLGVWLEHGVFPPSSVT